MALESPTFADTSCKDSFLVGVEVEIYGTIGGSGKSLKDDYRGATNLKMQCRDGTWLEGTNNEVTNNRQGNIFCNVFNLD